MLFGGWDDDFLHGGEQIALYAIAEQLQRVGVDTHAGVAYPLL